MSVNSLLTLGQLVGAQIRALVEAETQAADHSWAFIEKAGFSKDREGNRSLNMISFKMKRRTIGSETETYTIEIPLITLIPLPLLTISEADIDFNLNVESITKDDADTGQRSEKLTPRAPAILNTRLARTRSNSTDIKADMHVRVKIKQSDLPIGIERLINISDLAVTDKKN